MRHLPSRPQSSRSAFSARRSSLALAPAEHADDLAGPDRWAALRVDQRSKTKSRPQPRPTRRAPDRRQAGDVGMGSGRRSNAGTDGARGILGGGKTVAGGRSSLAVKPVVSGRWPAKHFSTLNWPLITDITDHCLPVPNLFRRARPVQRINVQVPFHGNRSRHKTRSFIARLIIQLAGNRESLSIFPE